MKAAPETGPNRCITGFPRSLRPPEAPVNLIYDSEILICNQNFPCYLTLIDMEKSVTCFFAENRTIYSHT